MRCPACLPSLVFNQLTVMASAQPFIRGTLTSSALPPPPFKKFSAVEPLHVSGLIGNCGWVNTGFRFLSAWSVTSKMLHTVARFIVIWGQGSVPPPPPPDYYQENINFATSSAMW